MQERSARGKAMPLRNLMHTVFSAVKHSGDVVKTLDSLMERPRDQHGNILLGIDGSDFHLWDGLKHIFTAKIFGPIVIATNPFLVRKILLKLKNTPEGFNGNPSSDLIGDLVGINTIFSAQDTKIHLDHKLTFKQFLSDPIVNLGKIAPIVQRWVQQSNLRQLPIDDARLQNLCARVMVRFLLGDDAAKSDDVLQAAIQLKSHFIELATKKKMHQRSSSFEEVSTAVRDVIHQLTPASDSFAGALLAKGWALHDIDNEICSLLMVGFDNLRGALSGLLYQYSRHPELYPAFAEALYDVNGYPYIQFDASVKNEQTDNQAALLFFKETTRVLPPVWLQARKNGDEAINITYTNMNGDELHYTVPPKATVLIPVMHLARQFRHETGSEPPLAMPFSIGPNDCPGRNIGYAAAGLLLGCLTREKLMLRLMGEPKMSPKVSLTLTSLDLVMSPMTRSKASALKVASIKKSPVKAPVVEEGVAVTERASTVSGTFWNIASHRATLSVIGGAATAVTLYYETETLLLAVGAGLLSASFLAVFLRGEQDEHVRLQLI